MRRPKKGTPEYEAWILTPEYEIYCKSQRGENNPMFGKPSPMKGKHHTEESNKKNSDSHVGVPIHSEERKQELSDHWVGESNPNFGKHPVPWNKGKRGIYSGITLHKMSEAKRGDKCVLWKGGISYEKYCPKFSFRLKERVRKFFNYTCQICGHAWQPGEKRLSVHHVNYEKMVCCNNIKPLFIPVCSGKCHNMTNINREYWEEVFTNIIMLEYDGECF
jgi:hypothetical protein